MRFCFALRCAQRPLLGAVVILSVAGCVPVRGSSGIPVDASQAPPVPIVRDNSVSADVPLTYSPARKILLLPKQMPKPFDTPSAENGIKSVVPRPNDVGLTIPEGFEVKLWAEGLTNPRIVVAAPNGDIFITESIPNRIRVLRDADNDGKPEIHDIFAEGLRQPFGLGFYPPGPNPQYLYVANTDSVMRFPYQNGDLKARGKAETLINDLPGGGYNQHWTRNLLFTPDGKKMLVSVGSQTNVGEEEEKRAAILEYNPDGTGYRVFASGIRNPIGLGFNPIGGALWTACNERDGLGDDLVPDYATAVKPNGFYGWPWYYIGANHDPRMKEKPELKSKIIVPDVLFTSHSAALGLEFYTGSQFPALYKNSAFVALHGSWNRAERTGYSIVRIPMDKKGRATGGYEEFLTGWTLPDGRVWGRPVDLAQMKDGSLLVTDDGAGKVWIVRYTGRK